MILTVDTAATELRCDCTCRCTVALQLYTANATHHLRRYARLLGWHTRPAGIVCQRCRNHQPRHTATSTTWQFAPVTAELDDTLAALPPSPCDQCAACGSRDAALIPTLTPAICADCLDRLTHQAEEPQ